MDILARTAIGPSSQAGYWQEKADRLYNLADSDFAVRLAEQFTIPDIAKAEAAFKQVLESISDPELKFAADSAAGRISRAYQMLGFCAGCLAQGAEAG